MYERSCGSASLKHCKVHNDLMPRNMVSFLKSLLSQIGIRNLNVNDLKLLMLKIIKPSWHLPAQG